MKLKNIAILVLSIWVLAACEDPYENVSSDKSYDGSPFVSLSSESASIHMSATREQEAGIFKDSIALSHVLTQDLLVTLEYVAEESYGTLNTNYAYQETVLIEAGENYGYFEVQGIDIPLDEMSKYKLSIRISEVNNDNVIAGMYGAKKENEAREKRFKTYSFQ